MPDFSIEVVGDRKVALRFEKFPERLRAAFVEPIQYLTRRLAGKVRQRAPRGKKGELPGLVIEQFFNDPDQVSGRVTFSDQYAKVGALEYGAPGPRNRNMVKEHKAQLGHFWHLRLNRPITVMVAAHRRQLNTPQFAMLRGPLAEMSGEVISELQAVVNTAAETEE